MNQQIDKNGRKIMTPAEKYTEERDTIKALRMNRIMEAAFKLFSEKGIDTITMNDIAKKAEIGVASLYRYYETKEQIAIQTSIWAWEKQKDFILPLLMENDYDNISGLEQVKKVISLFMKLYENQSDFLRYIYFFDSFAVRSKINNQALKDYENIILSIKDIISKAITKGINDKSINEKYKNKEEELYFTITHTMFSTTQKLALSKNLLAIDTNQNIIQELKMLSDILISGIKN